MILDLDGAGLEALFPPHVVRILQWMWSKPKPVTRWEPVGSREVYEPMAALYLEWGDALLAEGDYEAAAATYGRIRYDVPSARHWRTAEERGASAYCAWQAALRSAGDGAGAAWVCDMFADALPRMVGGCAGCGR